MNCSVPDCINPVKAKGLCAKHWKRQRNGKPLEQKSSWEMLSYEKFWMRVDVKAPHECWEWKGAKRGNEVCEYGSFWVGGKHMAAHRYSWMIENGPFPEGGDGRGMCVCHSCDNPLCVNPKHLFIGTHTDNMKDKISKGRCKNAAKTHCSKGHEYTTENTYVTKRGIRHCRQCHREYEKQRRERLRA